MNPPSTSASPTPNATDPNDAERREALRKLGVLAALTPPTLMTLLLSRRASAGSFDIICTDDPDCFT